MRKSIYSQTQTPWLLFSIHSSLDSMDISDVSLMVKPISTPSVENSVDGRGYGSYGLLEVM